MNKNKLITLVVAIALVSILALTIREAFASVEVVSQVNSATVSYTAWAREVETSSQLLNSATRSYAAWAKHKQCQVSAAPNFQEIDSATRSYIAWARAVEFNHCR